MSFLRLMIAACLALAAAGCRTDGQKSVAFLAGAEIAPLSPRPAAWAQPRELYGVPNFTVVDAALSRGDEPTAAGMHSLREAGVRTVVTVRWLHSTEGRAIEAGLRHEQIAMAAWAPAEEHVVKFLRIVGDPESRPVFLHCYTGADRAGLLTAVYRVVFCGWTKQQAKMEMLYGGYGFHKILVGYLVPFFDDLDIERVKRRAGITDEVVEQVARDAGRPGANGSAPGAQQQARGKLSTGLALSSN